MATDRPRNGLPKAQHVARTADLFRALGHDARLMALAALQARGPLPAGDIAELCGLEQTAMSHQLKVLKQARLVKTHRAGKHVIYALADDHVAHIVADALLHVVEAPRTSAKARQALAAGE